MEKTIKLFLIIFLYFYLYLELPKISYKVDFESEKHYDSLHTTRYLKRIKVDFDFKDFVIGFKQIASFRREEFANKIFKLVQSRNEFLLNTLNIDIYVSKTATGKGFKTKKSKAPETAAQRSQRKHSVINIKNKGK